MQTDGSRRGEDQTAELPPEHEAVGVSADGAVTVLSSDGAAAVEAAAVNGFLMVSFIRSIR